MRGEFQRGVLLDAGGTVGAVGVEGGERRQAVREMELVVFVAVVFEPAQTHGRGQPVAQVVGQLAERGRLLDGADEVVEIADVRCRQRVVEVVVRRVVGVGVVVGRLPRLGVHQRRVLRAVEPLVVDVLVERADHPLEPARASGGEADFLREAFLRLVVEDRAEGVLGVVKTVARIHAPVGVLVLLVDVVVPFVGDVAVEDRGGGGELGSIEVTLDGDGVLVPVVIPVLVEELDDLEVAEGRVGFPSAGG